MRGRSPRHLPAPKDATAILASLPLDLAVIAAALAATAGLRPAFGDGHRRVLWLVVAACGFAAILWASSRAVSPPGGMAPGGIAPGRLALGVHGAFALVLLGIAGARVGRADGSDAALALAALGVAAGGAIGAAAMAAAVLMLTLDAPWAPSWRGGAALLAALAPAVLRDMAPQAAPWITAGLFCAVLAWPGPQVSALFRGARVCVAAAACLAAWRVAAPPPWIAGVGAAIACGGIGVLFGRDAAAIAGRLAIGRGLLMLGIGAAMPDGGDAWALAALGVALAGAPGGLAGLACPPMPGGWGLWLMLHDGAFIADPLWRLLAAGALMACVALEWLAFARADRVAARDGGWWLAAIALCGAMPGAVLRALGPLVCGHGGQALWPLRAADGAVAYPWAIVLCALLAIFAAWRSGFLMPGSLRASGGGSIGGGRVWEALPVRGLRVFVRGRRTVRAMADMRAAWRLPLGLSPLHAWFVLLALALFWRVGR